MPTSNRHYQAAENYANAAGQRLVKIQLPIGEKHEFKGVIDLISMKAFLGDGKTASEIPAEMKDAAQEAHFALVEAAAEGEDALLEKYLENGSLSDEEIDPRVEACCPFRGLCTGAMRCGRA